MKRSHYYLLAGAASLMLTACDMKDKTPITGKREAVLAYSDNVMPDSASRSPLGVSQGTVNTRWSMPGGIPTHAQEPVALSKDPQQLWAVSVGSANIEDRRVTSSPVVEAGRVFSVDGYGKLTAVDAKTGAVLWTFDSTPEGEKSEGIGGGVSVSGQTVYMTDAFGEVLALGVADGKLKWRTKIGAPMRIGPTIAGNRLYVITINNEASAVSLDTGKVLWTHRGVAELAGILGGGSPAVLGDRVIVAFSSGEVIALNAGTGQVIWAETLTPSLSADTVAGIAHIRARPIIQGNLVHVISHGGRMVALDLATGEQRWGREISGLRSPAIASGHIFMVDTDNKLMAISAGSGSIRWIEPLPKSSGGNRIDWAGPIVAGGQLVLVGSHGAGILVSPDTGKIIKEISLPSGSSLSPVVAEGVLYVLTNDAKLIAYK